MEPKTKKILAVVCIAIAVTGLGIGLWILQPTGGVPTGVLKTPGVPEGTPSDHIIKVGILGPVSEIQGEGMWYGAYLACEKVNLAGGVNVSGETYYFGIVAEDTHEADISLDLTKGQTATTKILTQDNADFIMGGFRTESVLAYYGQVMTAKKLFLGLGASSDTFSLNVNNTYDTYKYWFQAAPINSTSLVKEVMTFLGYIRVVMETMTGKNITNACVLRENLDWNGGMAALLMGLYPSIHPGLPGLGFTNVSIITFEIDADSTDFSAYWAQMEADKTQLCVPLVSAQGGFPMMTTYASLQPKCLVAGINVMSQLDTFWDETVGGCRYEVTMQTLVRTNKTTKTIGFWDNYTSMWGMDPIYTAPAAYDAFNLLVHGINESQSLNSTEIIPYLEAVTWGNTLEGASGNLAFTSTHSPVEGYDIGTGMIYGVGLFTQWQANASKEVISTAGMLYPEWIVSAGLELPIWGINDWIL